MSGTERDFACLDRDTISPNLLCSWMKRNQFIDLKKKNSANEYENEGVKAGGS